MTTQIIDWYIQKYTNLELELKNQKIVLQGKIPEEQKEAIENKIKAIEEQMDIVSDNVGRILQFNKEGWNIEL